MPDGRWVYVPDLDSYLEQISYGPPPSAGLSWGMEEEEEEEEDEGTLAGSAWEGIKSIPSGVADIFLSGAQAAVGVATPFADLPVEKRLRKQSSKRARERDPAYQDAFLPAVGTGIGQVAGLSALSRLPGGWYAAMGAGIGMGISDQTRRIADYEQRTGTDVPWYKESAAHMMGALIGLTEVVPVKLGIFPTSVSKMMDRMKSGFSPNSLRRVTQLEAKYGFRDIATTALMEATQEASANWLQSVSARGLYDPDAMKDLARSMAEDFKVGGAVGGLVKLAQHQILRSKIRGGSSDRNANAEVMRARYRHDQIIKDVSSNITGISEEMSPVLLDLGIGRGLATDITRLMGGEFSAIPTGLSQILSSGEISRFQVKGLIKEFTARNESAKSQLDRLIEYHSNAGNDTEVERYIKARVAIDKMATARINNLTKNLPGLEGGLGDMGGLTGNMQYEEAKEAAIDADAVESMTEVHEARKKQKEYSKKPSFLTAIRSLMGGSYKLRGLFHMAESLGTHRGPGSEKVHLESLADDTQTIPDIELASSDRSNFDIASLGEMLFASRGKHEEASSDQQYVDKSDVMDGFRFGDSVRETLGSTQRTDARKALYDMDVKLEAVEKNNDALYKKHIFTRELSEIDRKKKYDSDEEWTQHRDETQSYISRQSQQNNAEISRINRERSIIYLRLLSDRLQSARTYFAGNISSKQKAAQRVLGSPNTDKFDLWLDKTINTVMYSEHNGQRMKDLASEKAREFEEGLAAETDVPDAEKEAARAAFISENTRRFVQLPRDISATQVTKIASLFVEDSKESEDVLEDAFEKRALADITVWRADDELYDVDPYGIPIVKKTRKVVAELEKKLERPLTDESGKVAPKRMHKEDISVDDVEKLLASKNIYLRDEIRIGSLLAKETGTGVESRPFEKLLEDMTGALSWENATYGQRLLMYSRLLQLPAHYKSRSSPEDRRYLLDRGTIEGVFEEADYRPLFLPDFYHNPSIDSHINFMADRVMGATVEGHLEFPSVSVGTLKRRTQAALGDKFNSKAYYESLARLIETGALNRTAEPAPARVSTVDKNLLDEADRLEDEADTWEYVRGLTGSIKDARLWHQEKMTEVELLELEREGYDVLRREASVLRPPLATRGFFNIPSRLGITFTPRIEEALRAEMGPDRDPNKRIELDEVIDDELEAKVAEKIAADQPIAGDPGHPDFTLAAQLARPELYPRGHAKAGQAKVAAWMPDWYTSPEGAEQRRWVASRFASRGTGTFDPDFPILGRINLTMSPAMGERSGEIEVPRDAYVISTDSGKGGTSWEVIWKTKKSSTHRDGVVQATLKFNEDGNPMASGYFGGVSYMEGHNTGDSGPGRRGARQATRVRTTLGRKNVHNMTVTTSFKGRGGVTKNAGEIIYEAVEAREQPRKDPIEREAAIPEEVLLRREKEKKDFAAIRTLARERAAATREAQGAQVHEQRVEAHNKREEAKILSREQRRKEAERAPSALSKNRVRFNVNFEPTEPAKGELRITEPGDDTRARDEKMWINETNPGLVHRLLSDPRWKNQIDDMLDSYNERRPGAQLNREEFVRQYTALVTSVTPLQDLSDLGILNTIQGAVAMPGGLAPTDNILDLGSSAGKNLVRALMRSGALPSSLQDNVHAVRRRFVDTMKTRFETLDGKVVELLQATRLPDNIQRQYVDDIDGLFQFMGEVAIRGEDMNADLPALYDRPGNRIIINLAAIDPNDMVSAEEVVKQAAFHEGLHALIIRDHLTEEELNVLYGFVRDKNNIVPKEIDEEAYNAQLTWFERSVVAHKDSGLAEADIEKEAIISLLENLTQHPDLYVEGKKTRTIAKGVRGFLEGFVDAAKDSDIVDVMRILGRIERGEVGERTAGFLGDTEYTNDSIVRSNDLLRYANPEDIRKLKAAIVLRDAAPSDQMREVEQAKIDDISDKIVANRGIIQESAPPPPDAVQAIENQRQAIEHYRATFSGEVPLLGLDQKNRDSEAYKLALDTFMEMRGKDPRYAYKMPEPYQKFFNKMSPLSPNLLSLVADVEKAGVITPLDGDVTRKSLEEGGILSGDYVRRPWWRGGGIEGDLSEVDTETLKDQPTTGDNIKDTVENLKGSVDGLRYLYLDRRQYIVKQTDRLIAAQNRAQLDAETSALVMWRNSDNALNWLSSLMLRGPLSYLGTTVGSGRFENAPIYDNDLQEKYGGDGRVQGLNDIIAPIIDAGSQQAALTYGLIKRVRWTRDRLESIQSATAGVDSENLNPETRRKLKLFQESYEDIKVAVRKLTEAQMDDIVQEIETKESNKIIVEFWDRYKAYDNHMIKMSYNTGMITREIRDEWLSMPYAPFYRETMENEDFPIGSQEQMAKRRKNVVEKALTESMKPITSKLSDSIITNTQALVRDAMMNTAVSRTVRDAVALGEARKINISAVAASLDDRVVRVMEHGVPTYYQLDDAQVAMSAMLLGFNPKKQLQKLFGEHKLGKFMQTALTKSSSFLRDAVTRTPPFATKNVFRDSWNAMSLTGGGPRLILEAFGNAINPDSLRRADELGLSIGVDFVAEPGEYGNKMRSELKKANLDWKNPLNAFSILWNFSGRIAKQSEVATRLAVYDRILAMTGDKALAVHYAIEIMNYGRRGASPVLSTYMATVPFMNGRLEGLDVTYRGLRGKKGSSDIPGVYGYGLTTGEYEGLPFWKKTRAKVVSRGLALTAATGVLYLLMRDDEEWQDLRDETRSDNWVLPLSDHAWIKIPIPFEIGVIFKVIPEKMFEAITEADVDVGDVGEEAWRQLRTSLSIGGPQLFTPVVNAMRNYDTFRKDGIVDSWMEETLSPNEQRNRYTSNVARGVADLANSVPLVNKMDFLTSPMKVEYMMRQYLGTMGSYVVTVADRIARTGILPDIPFDPYMNLAEAESVIGTNKDFDWKSLIGGEGIANVPLLGDLLTDPRTRQGSQQAFFEMIEDLDTVLATLSSITDRDYLKGFEYRKKHLDILRHQRQLRFMQNQLKQWRERRDHLSKIPPGSMSTDEMREYHQRLLESRQSILASVNDLMASIRQE